MGYESDFSLVKSEELKVFGKYHVYAIALGNDDTTVAITSELRLKKLLVVHGAISNPSGH
jgi:uncharacterized membrane protein